MKEEPNYFESTLERKKSPSTPIYCTGYPEPEFMSNYLKEFPLPLEDSDEFYLKNKNYETIQLMGFDGISLWDYRRGKGGYSLSNGFRVDGWGRIYKGSWYQNDGVFKNPDVIDEWKYLKLPAREDMDKLAEFLPILRRKLSLVPVISLPGLFEKTWQSMGLVHFSKCLRKDENFIIKVINYFSKYIIKLVGELQKTGANIFIIADDCGYNYREFIPSATWKHLFVSEYKQLVKLIHQEHQKIILHSDGYITNMIPHFLEIGFDAIQSLEPNAGINIFELFEEYGAKICFIGNIDINELVFSTPQRINNLVSELILNAERTNSSLIISPTQQINQKVKAENVEMMIKSAKQI